MNCGQCKHWHGKPKAPPPAGVAVVINSKPTPIHGDCRAMPPSVTVIAQQGGPISVSSYPDLPEDFPACGQFAAKVLTTGGADR